MKKETIEAYYKDMLQELQARSRFPNTSQNKRRIKALKKDLRRFGRVIEQ